jgi:hypothetical protein
MTFVSVRCLTGWHHHGGFPLPMQPSQSWEPRKNAVCSHTRTSSNNHLRSNVKRSLKLSDPNEYWNVSTTFRKILQYTILSKPMSISSRAASYVQRQTDGQTERFYRRSSGLKTYLKHTIVTVTTRWNWDSNRDIQGRAMISWGPGTKLLFGPTTQIFVYSFSWFV